ncbi:type VI secretion protein IcmF/TssM N-terminal domain-containing protein [Buttiauxella gaviniae]|uniref:Type VI secretion protein IcmF/TssM N-terminal domain-containing protein n=1 Tax=Buttiauxella gaviniae TaxID=82990 RepID=A0ABV3NY80_9ENTR
MTILLVWLSVLITGVVSWSALLWLTQSLKQKKTHRFLQKFRLSRREYVLFEHWKTGAAVIKRIQRKRPPIPWYLLLGDRCGKTSLLAGSNLPMFSNDVQDNAVAPTHTLRWWFFRNVCVLDLSANFLNGTPTFQRAWGKLVNWIAREPAPAGIMIGLSVTDLMNDDISVLHDKARKIRAQIEPLGRKLQRQLPLYITITQCDKFPAFSLWTKQLSPAQQQQALGYYWQTPPDIDGKDPSTLLPLFSTLKNGFDLTRISMGGESLSPEVRTELLSFPESFAQLERPLLVFLASLCEPNAYFTRTALGGVWFTASELQDKNKSRRATYFVHDLLGHHLQEFSRTRDILWLHNKRFRAVASRVLLLSCVCALGYSALRSADLMEHNTARMSSTELADLLMKNETHRNSPLLYLPFSLVLNHQHQLIEQRLQAKLPTQSHNFELMLATYQQQFMLAPAQTQRQMVLSLAQTIITRQSMREGATLQALSLRPVIPVELHLNTIDPSASPVARLALERQAMQQPAGASQLQASRQLLSRLINADRTLAWLIAPDDTLPAVQASDFWPQFPASATLSGIWTQQGQAKLTEWVDLIAQAGNKTELQPFVQTLPVLRQNAWREFLLTVIPWLQNPQPRSLSPNQLIALSQGQSPGMKLAQRIAFELDGIPTQSAQPWLLELKKLQKLSMQAGENPTFQKVKHVDATLRGGMNKWLQGGTFSATAPDSIAQTTAWQQWQKALNAAAALALNQAALSPDLTDGLFAPQAQGKNINPLVTLFASTDHLRKTLEPHSQEPGVEAVWALYQSDVSMLLSHALARSGCWINEQWQSKVLWPMRKNANGQDYEALQALTWQYLADFVRGPARGLLVVNDQGPQPGKFRGQSLPLTDEFVSLTRHLLNPEDVLDVPLRQNTQNADQLAILNDRITQLTQQQKALETKPYRVTIVSRPATVPEGARLIPTGSRLTLECQNGVNVLDSMNFAEQAQFNWSPGQCQSVKVEVKFPDFTATYSYTGDSAWPDFLQQFIRGEALLNARDFEDNTEMLTALNIKHVLLRFKISDQTVLQNAWMSWLTLNEQLTTLKEQKQALEGKLSEMEPSTALRGRLSGLPENAADCR